MKTGDSVTLYLVAHDKFDNLFNTTNVEGTLSIKSIEGLKETDDYTYTVDKEGVG